MQHLLRWVTLLALCGVACNDATTGSPTTPIQLTVTNFGQTMFGAPFAVAKDKGFFKEVGIDVTGFITSAGGGTTIRNALASEIPYGEVALAAAIAAIQQGVELTIVHAGVVSVADQVWVTRKDDTSIKTFADLRGKRLAYSSPQSVTDMITTMLLDQAKLAGQVERRSTGTIAAGLTALRAGGVDMAYVNEPVWSQEKGNYRMGCFTHLWKGLHELSLRVQKIAQLLDQQFLDHLGFAGRARRAIVEGRLAGARLTRSAQRLERRGLHELQVLALVPGTFCGFMLPHSSARRRSNPLRRSA